MLAFPLLIDQQLGGFCRHVRGFPYRVYMEELVAVLVLYGLALTFLG